MSDGTGSPPAASALELQVWLSPAFPVGSFAYSHALEWAVATGRIRDRATAEAWLADLLGHGAPRNDAILLAAAWHAMASTDRGRLIEVNALALALSGSRERHLETSAQGNAFMTSVLAAWGNLRLTAARAALDGDIAYPVAIAVAASARGHPLPATLTAFVTAAVGNLVSALVRLSAIGQTDGQRVIAALGPSIEEVRDLAAASTLDDLGGAAFLSDIGAMAHETEETRMFRT